MKIVEKANFLLRKHLLFKGSVIHQTNLNSKYSRFLFIYNFYKFSSNLSLKSGLSYYCSNYMSYTENLQVKRQFIIELFLSGKPVSCTDANTNVILHSEQKNNGDSKSVLGLSA